MLFCKYAYINILDQPTITMNIKPFSSTCKEMNVYLKFKKKRRNTMYCKENTMLL